MRPSDRDLEALGPFPGGANNLARETEVPRTQLREAVNVDLSDRGTIRRRRGYAKLEALNDAGALLGYGRRGFVLEGDELLAFEVEGNTLSGLIPIASGLRPGKLAHTLIEPDIFVSDGVQNLRIAPDNTVSQWTPPLLPAPQVDTTDGSLDPGRYQLVVVSRMASGEEGPPSDPVDITIYMTAGLALSFGPTPPGVHRIAIYMTKPNGRELLLAGAVPAGVATVTLGWGERGGNEAETEFEARTQL